MKTKKWILPCIILGAIAFCAVVLFAALGIMSAKGYGFSTGRLYLHGTEFFLVDEGEAMVMSDQSKGKKLFDGINTGDLIFVLHDGVEESYPSRTGAYRVFRLSKGDENDLPENLNIGVDTEYEARLKQSKAVRHERGYANISINIFDGWKYEIEESDENNDFCISFWPDGKSYGKIKVWYYDFFGVCGTDLKQEKITIGNYEAYKGSYGNSWKFIALVGTPGNYIIKNENIANWWSEYGNEAMQMLSTLVVGEGFIGEDEAIALAKEKASVDYDYAWGDYNSETGIWTITLYKSGDPDGSQDIKVTCEGKIFDNK